MHKRQNFGTVQNCSQILPQVGPYVPFATDRSAGTLSPLDLVYRLLVHVSPCASLRRATGSIFLNARFRFAEQFRRCVSRPLRAPPRRTNVLGCVQYGASSLSLSLHLDILRASCTLLFRAPSSIQQDLLIRGQVFLTSSKQGENSGGSRKGFVAVP